MLRQAYGDDLKFFTKAQLNYEKYDYFPHPLPDAYLRLTAGDQTRQFFLDVFRDDQPFFVAVRRVLSYVSYAEEDGWSVTGTDLPVALAVCESTSLAKRVQKRMVKALNDAWYDDVRFAFSTSDSLKNGVKVTWYKPEDSVTPYTLHELD